MFAKSILDILLNILCVYDGIQLALSTIDINRIEREEIYDNIVGKYYVQ